MIKRIVLGTTAGLLGLGTLAVVMLNFSPQVQDRVLRAVAARRMQEGASQLLDKNTLSVLICGSASPLPHPTRAKPCTAVFAAGRFWIVDTGPGSWNRLALWQIDGKNIGGVFLTHFHSDHIAELGEFNMQSWVGGRGGPLQVYGAPGVERVVAGFSEAYALDSGYRTAHHGAPLLPPEAGRMQARVVAGPAERGGSEVVLQEDGLTITAFKVTHTPVEPAYGYRFDYGGRSVVISGDTVKDKNLISAARGVDVLVHEAQANHLVSILREEADTANRPRLAKLLGDIPSYHTSPVEAAEIANEAGVRLLILSHLTPPPPIWFVNRAFVRGVSDVRKEGWLLADDGLVVSLPANGTEIRTSSLE